MNFHSIYKLTFTNILMIILSSNFIIGQKNGCPSTVKYEEKTYNTVMIGKHCWLKQNLDLGTMIQGDQNQTDKRKIEKYCYENEPANYITYGGFYQWN